MAIQVVFYQTRPATIGERILDKVKACYEAVRVFNNTLFHPQEIQVWLDATSLALGGKQVRVIPINNLYEDSEKLYQYLIGLPFTELTRSIVMFSGRWTFNNVELEGYFSVQNQDEWRKTYGDLTISTYAKGDYHDIVDGFWSLENARKIILDLIRSLAHPSTPLLVRPAQVSFSHGIYSDEDPTNLMAIYLSGERRSLLKIFYKALIASEDQSVVLKSKPLETKFLLDTLISNAIVTRRINKRLERDLIDELPAGSSLYFGRNPDSFKKLFAEITDAVLRPAFSKLPEATKVAEQIEEGLEEYKDENDN